MGEATEFVPKLAIGGPDNSPGTVPGSADSQDNHDGSDGHHRYSGPGGQGAVSGSPGASGVGRLRDGQGRKVGHQTGQVLPGPRAECLAGPLVEFGSGQAAGLEMLAQFC